MTVTSLAPWFGSNRMLGHEVGKRLSHCSWVGIPFAGGMSEIRHIKSRTIVANDLHRHIINLANVVASPIHGPALRRRLDNLLFHPDVLQRCQSRCISKEAGHIIGTVEWAEAYFVCCWQGRSSRAGTKGEFQGQLALRWNSSGGDSSKRYYSAVEALDDWRDQFKRVTFSCMDVIDFLGKCKDASRHGIYVDPPFPGTGDGYKHTMDKQKHIDLASTLSGYSKTEVVCRFYDEPMVRDLYPEPSWVWNELSGRNQANNQTPEVLVTRNLSCGI